MAKLLYRIPEAAEVLGLSRSKVYDLIADGRLEVVYIGAACRVPSEALDRFVETLPAGRPGRGEAAS